MNALRGFQRCAAALSILGITSYITATFATFEPALGIALVGLPAVGAGWWFSIRRGLRFPRWTVNGMLMLAVAYAALRASSSRVTVEVIAELVVFIEFIKLTDRRGPRDDAQIISLTVFLGIAAMLTSNALWVGLQLIAFIPLLIATVMLFQVYAGWSAAGAPAPAPTIRARGAFRWTVGLATVGTLALTLFVFIIMPRGVGEDFLGSFSLSERSRTAFSDHVKLGSTGIISQSPRIVMNFSVHQSGLSDDDVGPNLGAADAVYYLRGAVLQEEPSARGTWTAVHSGGQPEDITSGQDLQLLRGVRAPLRQDIVLQNADASRAVLFSLWRPAKLRVGRGKYDTNAGLGTVSMRRSGGPAVVSYTVWSTPVDHPGLPPPVRTPLPSPAPGPIRDLALSLVTAAGVDPDPGLRPVEEDTTIARAIQDHLQRRYRYTLESPGAPSRTDPVEHFLFQAKEGHCEYFAAAMVRLCHAVGVNARMVAGYVAAEFNESSGRYVVRESNAHAWVEVEIGTGRWRRYDPTPPSDLVRLHRGQTGLLARLRQAVESVEYAWNAGVVSFDESSRQRIFSPSEERPGIFGLIDAIGAHLHVGGPRTFLRALAAGIGVFILVWLMGTGLSWAIVRLNLAREHRRRERFPVQAGLTPARRAQLRFYARHLELLRKRGHPKPEWKPPLDHAGAIAPSDATLADQSSRLSTVYYRATFGNRDLSAGDLAEAERLIGAMASRRP